MVSEHAKLVRRAQRETDPDKALALWQRVFGDRFRKSAPKSGGLMRTATAVGGGLGLAFPAKAVVPPNKPPGFA
jgi:hypothetical protein